MMDVVKRASVCPSHAAATHPTAWLITGVKTLGATTVHIAWALLPLMLVWAWLAHFLARRKERLL